MQQTDKINSCNLDDHAKNNVTKHVSECTSYITSPTCV